MEVLELGVREIDLIQQIDYLLPITVPRKGLDHWAEVDRLPFRLELTQNDSCLEYRQSRFHKLQSQCLVQGAAFHPDYSVRTCDPTKDQGCIHRVHHFSAAAASRHAATC